MRDFSAAELVDIWERGVNAPPVERALDLLAAAHGLSSDDIASWPIGTRDARLLEFRERTFGPVLETLAECPHCGNTTEAAVRIADLLALDKTDSLHEWQHDGLRIRFRPVNSADILAVIQSGESETALLERCIIENDAPNAAAPIQHDAFALALADADPLADITLDFQCPDCGGAWTAPLDVVSYVWTEIAAWAARALDDVHRLAIAYGWSEAAILALSPARRAAYLERIES